MGKLNSVQGTVSDEQEQMIADYNAGLISREKLDRWLDYWDRSAEISNKTAPAVRGTVSSNRGAVTQGMERNHPLVDLVFDLLESRLILGLSVFCLVLWELF